MITPSGRFQTSTRLCLSISDFHPKSFNPAWEVSTILIGLLSFMTSEEMTTGSVSGSEQERKRLAGKSRWWNSTGGGAGAKGGKVGLGDGGARFRQEWPEVDKENWEWMKKNNVDPATGTVKVPQPDTQERPVGDVVASAGLVRRMTASGQQKAGSGPKGQGQVVIKQGESWVKRNKVWVGLAVLVGYVLLARALE